MGHGCSAKILQGNTRFMFSLWFFHSIHSYSCILYTYLLLNYTFTQYRYTKCNTIELVTHCSHTYNTSLYHLKIFPSYHVILFNPMIQLKYSTLPIGNFVKIHGMACDFSTLFLLPATISELRMNFSYFHFFIFFLLIFSFSYTYIYYSSAQDKVNNKKVAIKKLARPFQSAVHAKRTYRELRLLKHMNHENVIGLLDVFHPGGNTLETFQQVYLCTHLMGADLNNIIRTQRLSDDHVQFLVYQILRGLKYIHSAGIIHRVSEFINSLHSIPLDIFLNVILYFRI